MQQGRPVFLQTALESVSCLDWRTGEPLPPGESNSNCGFEFLRTHFHLADPRSINYVSETRAGLSSPVLILSEASEGGTISPPHLRSHLRYTSVSGYIHT